jgi:hypothetical protein
VPRPRRSRLPAIAGALILAGLGAWSFGRRRSGQGGAQPVAARAPEHSLAPAAAAVPQLEPAAAASADGERARDGDPRRPLDSTPRRPRHARRLALWLPATLGALAALALGAWIFIAHGDMLVMQTPSMGTTAPAGSLVLTRPIGDVALRRGMVVAFHVPSTGALYMHRVAQLLPGGAFRTRGDLNTSDDGWELTRSSIVGVPVAIIPDLGWVVSGLPWALAVLAAGAIISLVLPRFLRPAMRSVTVGGAFALPLYLVRPFVRVAVASAGRLATAAAASGGSAAARGAHHGGVTMASSSRSGANFLARLVNGGVLPLRITITGTHTVIEPGHAGIIACCLRSRSACWRCARDPRRPRRSAPAVAWPARCSAGSVPVAKPPKSAGEGRRRCGEARTKARAGRVHGTNSRAPGASRATAKRRRRRASQRRAP